MVLFNKKSCFTGFFRIFLWRFHGRYGNGEAQAPQRDAGGDDERQYQGNHPGDAVQHARH